MSAATSARSPAAPAAKTGTSVLRGLLQRKCACGSSMSPLAGKCDDCQSSGLQRKLAVGMSDDPFEHEADRVAEDVLTRKPVGSAAAKRVNIRQVPVVNFDNGDAPISVDRALAGSGTELAPELRRDMEQRFGYDFGSVRVHSDSTAAESARDVNAHAYTVGHNIVFGSGAFSPNTESGRRLIAHELAHVVQQTGAAALTPEEDRMQHGHVGRPAHGTRKMAPSAREAFEGEADRIAGKMTRSAPPPTSSAAPAPHAGATLDFDSLAPSDLTLGGTPMPSGLRNFFEGRFGRDLGEVRLHTGPLADARSEQLDAHAFTYGNHVWLGRGQRPEAGFLLAHELTHVIQQRQPRALKSAAGRATQVAGATTPKVQRFGDSVPFWVPLGPAGRSSGEELHEEILRLATKPPSKLDTEVNAPNADRKGCGVGHHGKMDLYRSTPTPHVMPGFWWEGAPDHVDDQGEPQVRDIEATHTIVKSFAGAKSRIKSGQYRPYAVGDKKIDGMNEGPKTVELGELKPASQKMVEEGAKQLSNYQCGMRQSSRLTYQWAQLNGIKDPAKLWNLQPPQRLPGSAFTATDVGGTRHLVVADIRENLGRGAKYHVKVREPWIRGALNVTGRVRVLPYTKGSGPSGLWIYYARPDNLESELENLRSASIGADIDVANDVQNQVLDPLLHAPEHTAGFSRSQGPWLQRKPKYNEPPGKFEDKFVLSNWRTSQKALRARVDKPKGADKKQLNALELADGAYDAENALAKMPGAPKSALPKAKSKTDLVNVVSTDPKSKAKKKHEHSLGDVSGWLQRWTGVPVEILGFFRAGFGTAFVKVAAFFSGIGHSKLFMKIKDTFKSVFSKAATGTSAFITLMKEGLAFALGKVADLLLPSVFRMVTQSVKTGVEIVVKDLFKSDLVDEVIKQVGVWNERLKSIEQKIGDAFKTITDIINKIAAVIQASTQIIDTVNKVRKYVKWGLRLAKCSGLWTCLANLADLFTDIVEEKIINALKSKVLSACNFRSLVASAVRSLLKDIPVKLADGILEGIRTILPDIAPLQKIFSQPIKPETLPELKEMEDTDCWGIDLGFSLFDEGFSHPDKGSGKPSDPQDDPGRSPGKTPGKPTGKSPDTTPPPDAGKTPDKPPAKVPDVKAPPKNAPDQMPDPTSPQTWPWTPDELSIDLMVRPPNNYESGYVPERFTASKRQSRLQERIRPEYKSFCVSPTLYHATLWYSVEGPFRHRPQPFTIPTVALRWKAGKNQGDHSDSNPGYTPPKYVSGIGWMTTPLHPSFPVTLTLPMTDGEVLEIYATLADPDTGTTIEFKDKVTMKITPCT